MGLYMVNDKGVGLLLFNKERLYEFQQYTQRNESP